MPNMIEIKVGGEAQPVFGDLWPHAQKKIGDLYAT